MTIPTTAANLVPNAFFTSLPFHKALRRNRMLSGTLSSVDWDSHTCKQVRGKGRHFLRWAAYPLTFITSWAKTARLTSSRIEPPASRRPTSRTFTSSTP